MFKIKLNNTELSFDKPVRALELIPNEDKYKYCACKINNRLRELTYIINRDSELEFLDLNDYNAIDLYQNSLRFIFKEFEFSYWLFKDMGYTVFIKSNSIFLWRT